MATRLTLTSVGVSVPTVTPDSSWELATTIDRAGAATRRLGSRFIEEGISDSVATNPYDVLIVQWVSQPLEAQTISGYVKGVIRARETNVAAEFRAQMVIRVVSSEGGSIRGTLLAHDASALSNEFDTVLTNRKFPLNWTDPGAALTSVAALLGDRLVIEVGYRSHNSTATSYTGYLETGDGSDSYCAENETDTLQYNPWMEFSQTLLFQEWLSQETSADDSGNLPGLESSSRDAFSQRVPEFALAGGTVIEPPIEVKGYYKMRAQDSGVPSPGYVSWVVQGTPDFAGVGYSGGSPAPVGAMVAGSAVVAAEWQE